VEPEPHSMLVVPAWIEAHCVVPDGFRAGRPFALYDWQLLWFLNFYLVRGDAPWWPDNPVLAPAFVYRRGLLVGPQKLGKNPMIAAHVCAEFVGPVLFAGWADVDDGYACADHGCRCGWEYSYEPGEPRGMAWPTPKIQVTAFSEDSTENTYDALRPMISQGPLANLLPKAGEEFIRHPSGAEDSRIDTVTSSNQSRLGARSTFVPQDELGLWTAAAKMVKLADTQYRNLAGMGGRAALTTNAWDPSEHSIAQREADSPDTDVYRQFTRPPANLSFGNKVERRRIIRHAYPSEVWRENGGHVDLDAIEAEAASLATHDEAQAARFFGNMVVAGAGSAVDPKVWADQARPKVGKPPSGTRIGLGFDGSVSRDSTILRGCTAGGYRFTLGAWERPEKAPPDWTIPRLEVNAAVDAAFATYDVGLFHPDPPYWYSEVEAWRQRYGEARVKPIDTFQARLFAPIVDRWRTGIANGTLTHDGDPVVTSHVLAARLRKVRLVDPDDDGRIRYVLVKGDDRRHIDGAIADALAVEAAATMGEAPPKPKPLVVMGRPWGSSGPARRRRAAADAEAVK